MTVLPAKRQLMGKSYDIGGVLELYGAEEVRLLFAILRCFKMT